MHEQGFVNFGQACENRRVGGEVLAHSDEGSDNIEAHGDSTRAVDYAGNHQRAVLHEGVRAMTPASASL